MKQLIYFCVIAAGTHRYFFNVKKLKLHRNRMWPTMTRVYLVNAFSRLNNCRLQLSGSSNALMGEIILLRMKRNYVKILYVTLVVFFFISLIDFRIIPDLITSIFFFMTSCFCSTTQSYKWQRQEDKAATLVTLRLDMKKSMYVWYHQHPDHSKL